MSLFDEIRGACLKVAEGAQLVRIDRARLRDYAISLTSHCGSIVLIVTVYQCMPAVGRST